MISETPGIDQYLDAIQEMQIRVVDTQREILAQVAQAMAKVVQNNQRLLLFGTGHSGLVLEEAFTCTGGFVAAVPMFSSSLMLHENTEFAMRLERISGAV